jgi:hypothetical protein
MSAGRIIGNVIAAILIFFGVLFIWAAFSEQGSPNYIIVGIITAGVGLGIIAFIRLRDPKPPQEIIQKVDLSGDVGMEKLHCKNCGAELEKESITVKAGAVIVSCPYCGSDYQVVEEPKW